ncbi:MAG: hypothetical protein EBV06_10230 [Planctomycetia bacterium]|nr:hypothetical protein [Planctomycetia bacterium]
MAEMTIRLVPDPQTGKKQIIISMKSDEDALPHEHEQAHRAVVDKLIQGGLVKAQDIGQIVVTRDEPEKQPASPQDSGSQTQRQGVKQGR